METIKEIRLPRKKLKGLLQDAVRSAEVIKLIYVSDKEPGICRIKKGKGFAYVYNGKAIADKKIIHRIRSLVIPPAWERVWICFSEAGHLQATGYDTKNRKQYLYHQLWREFRNQTKFFQLLEFGKKLPVIREQLEKDLARSGLPLEKILGAIVSIMLQTNIRVGSNAYERLYGSFGITTLKDKHVQINGSVVKFCFKGKKGVYHEVDLKSRKLANIVKQCKDMPGKELFQYYDDNKERKSIDSGMVNEYIKQISGGDFTTKDFRTWTGTVNAISVLKEIGCSETDTETKRRIAEALDEVARRLGNTRSVCKKYYVHPRILELYSSKELEKFFNNNSSNGKLSVEEEVLMKIIGEQSFELRA